ncbi:MAG: response regulator [Desulfosarcina sp.]|nr:response regulator [Desulfobacterales bacterium]
MDAGLKKILLINCDSQLRESLADHLYADTASYRLLTAGDGSRALEILASADIFLAVIGVSAGETFPQPYFKEILAGYPHLETILILPPDDTVRHRAIPSHPNLQIIEAPCDAVHLGRRINELSQGHNQGFAGTLKNIQLDDLIQMCCLSAATITIRVSKGAQQGTIHIWDGEIAHAVCGQLTGEEAFYPILGWKSGGFETLDGGVSEVATIKKSYEFLLMEAARRVDESDMLTEDDAAPVDSDSVLGASPKLRVLMVEDSIVMGKILGSMLAASGDIEVAGIARNGEEALQLAEELRPDIILLDVNMPVMNGKAALKHIMIKNPCPVVVMSNVGSGSPESVLSFLDLGAVDFMAKPVKSKDLLLQQQKIVERIHRAAVADIRAFRRLRGRAADRSGIIHGHQAPAARRLVIVSAGCSGHGTMRQLFTGLPEDSAAALVGLQSTPPVFLPTLAAHLGKYSRLSVDTLADDTPLRRGHFYLSTHGCSLRLNITAGTPVVRMQDGRQDYGYGPSYFDLLLFSAADCFGENLQVVLLSGAETGNLEGLRYVRENGGHLLIQQRASCMMPAGLKAAVEADLCNEECEPETISNCIAAWCAGQELNPPA